MRRDFNSGAQKKSIKMELDLDKVVYINDNGYHYCYHTGEN